MNPISISAHSCEITTVSRSCGESVKPLKEPFETSSLGPSLLLSPDLRLVQREGDVIAAAVLKVGLNGFLFLIYLSVGKIGVNFFLYFFSE